MNKHIAAILDQKQQQNTLYLLLHLLEPCVTSSTAPPVGNLMQPKWFQVSLWTHTEVVFSFCDFPTVCLTLHIMETQPVFNMWHLLLMEKYSVWSETIWCLCRPRLLIFFLLLSLTPPLFILSTTSHCLFSLMYYLLSLSLPAPVLPAGITPDAL